MHCFSPGQQKPHEHWPLLAHFPHFGTLFGLVQPPPDACPPLGFPLPPLGFPLPPLDPGGGFGGDGAGTGAPKGKVTSW